MSAAGGTAAGLPVVDGLELPEEVRALLRPGETVPAGGSSAAGSGVDGSGTDESGTDESGTEGSGDADSGRAGDGAAGRPLPRWFYEIDSWETARSVTLAPYFGLYELISVDVREAPRLRRFPRYVPIALAHLAAHLSALRQHLGTYVHVAANGGYRSPGHALATGPSGELSPHCWGTAANLYRIGDDRLDTEAAIDRYSAAVREALPAAWCRPWGRLPGSTLDHLHLDLGRFVVKPR